MSTNTARRLATTALLLPALALADARIEMSTDKTDTDTLVMQVKDGKTRWDQTGEANGSVLFDAATRTMTVLNHQDRTWMMLDKATVDGVSDRMRQAMEQMEQQLANMPPEQREMILQRMPGFGEQKSAPVFSAESSGGGDKINGIKCKNVRLLKDGQPFSDACVADANALDISDEDYETLATMFETMQDMASNFAGSKRAVPMRDIGGLPVRSQNLETGEVSEILAVSDDRLESELFEVPAGYSQQSMPKF